MGLSIQEWEVLPEAVWQEQERSHVLRCDAMLSEQCKRRSNGKRHPVYDFLFEYYSFTPREIRRWTPGAFILLEGVSAKNFLIQHDYVTVEGRVAVNVEKVAVRRKNALQFIAKLLEETSLRPSQFGCYGLHEWAMVYREKKPRHASYSLRMTDERLAEFVESQKLACTHFDAYRFFTEEARPLNRFKLLRATQSEFDQRGCLHANMDLYKWCYKLYPLCPSHLLLETFALAWEAREMDMRASPYDLSSLGFPAIAIETPEGRMQYEDMQRAISKKAEPLRHAILQICKLVMKRFPIAVNK